MTLTHLVMAALVAAIHVFKSAQAVDGGTKPRHDETEHRRTFILNARWY